MAINGEYDHPNARTHRLTREARNFTKLVLPSKGDLSAMMAGFIRWPFVGRLNSCGDDPRDSPV